MVARGVAALVVGAMAVACGPSPDFYYEDVAGPADVAAYERPEPEDVGETASSSRESVLGHWSGVGDQSDGPRWKMELDVSRTDAGVCAIVRYPDLGCSGYWTCLEDGASHRIHAVERITEGRDRCADGVDVDIAMSHDGSRLVFEASAGDIRAKAKLRRRPSR